MRYRQATHTETAQHTAIYKHKQTDRHTHARARTHTQTDTHTDKRALTGVQAPELEVGGDGDGGLDFGGLAGHGHEGLLVPQGGGHLVHHPTGGPHHIVLHLKKKK